MKTINRLFCGFAALIFLLSSALFYNPIEIKAAAHPTFVRIGLESHFREQDQIVIHSHSLAVGNFISGIFHIAGILATDTNFVANPNNMHFVRLNMFFHTMLEAQNMAAFIHIDAAPAQLPEGGWGLYIAAASAEQAQIILSTFSDAVILPPNNRRVSISTNGRIVLVSDNVLSNLQVQDVGGITSLGIRRYRGIIELARFEGNRLTAVNVIDIEEYLLSVVPAEMPASWPIEALKAQTLAARTFTVHRIGLGRFASRGYDLCDTTVSQVYVGVSNEHVNTTRAVNETRGMLIFFNGQPIEAVYSSSSGGFTENSESAWGSFVPYLRSVREINETTARQWTRTITLTEINRFLATAGVNIGQATSIRIESGANGRVQELTIIGTNGSHVVIRENIRSFFNPSLDSRNFTIVGGMTLSEAGVNHNPSNQFQTNLLQQAFIRNTFGSVSQINLAGLSVRTATGVAILNQQDFSVLGAFGAVVIGNQGHNLTQNTPLSTTTSIGYSIILQGSGWGHGVGMSQHGARGMAEMGFNFIEILQHYYTGVEIR